jgi:hypothetical protein
MIKVIFIWIKKMVGMMSLVIIMIKMVIERVREVVQTSIQQPRLIFLKIE